MSTPRYSPRRVLEKEMAIFRLTGTPIRLIMREASTPAAYQPGQLYTNDTEAAEATDDTSMYIFAQFNEDDQETFGTEGRTRIVTGVIKVPMLYKSYLAASVYLDPYLDGSRFRKTGAIVDVSRLFVTQRIESYSLASVGEVV